MTQSTPFYDVVVGAIAGAMGARRMVELGTFHGRTTCVLASIARLTGGHVWTVDNDRERGISAARAAVEAAGYADVVTFRQANSDAGWWDGPPVDLVFFDADHSLAGLRREWAIWAPVIRRGGVALIHDTASHDPAKWAAETFPCEGWSALRLPWMHGLVVAVKDEVAA